MRKREKKKTKKKTKIREKTKIEKRSAKDVLNRAPLADSAR